MWLVIPMLLLCVASLSLLGIVLWIDERRYGKQHQDQQGQRNSAGTS